ncbi:MAG: Na+/H+ antiporter NhaA [Bacteroidales bacterium]
MELSKLYKAFFKSESSSGIILIVITFMTMFTVNFVLKEQFLGFWDTPFIGKPLNFWINDVLMTFFFLLVGFEIEREIYVGELSKFKQALLPIFAAIGGMIVPALVYVFININSGSLAGFGIPMATDIAFSLTILTIIASRIPSSLKIFLTALAIIDDLGAIIIIAIFYTKNFSVIYLAIAIAIYALLFLFNRKGIKNLLLYFLPAIVMWICFYKSGIHPTITGVLLAFVIPFGNGDEKSLSHRIESKLHRPVAYIVLPLFAIANTGILIQASDFVNLLSVNSMGIILGLAVGKPVGILFFSWVAVKLKICSLFDNIQFKHILGAGMVAGIGFTMSIFITLLAFEDIHLIKNSKLAIIIASFISAIGSILFIIFTNKQNKESQPANSKIAKHSY